MPVAVPSVADADVAQERADPLEVGEIDHWLVRRQHLRDQPGIEGGDDGAVLRRGGVEIAHRRHAGRARHVLHDHVRIAGDVAAVVPRQHARVDVVAAAGRIADDQRHGLAVVEGLLRDGASMHRSDDDAAQRRAHHRTLAPAATPLPNPPPQGGCPLRGNERSKISAFRRQPLNSITSRPRFLSVTNSSPRSSLKTSLVSGALAPSPGCGMK